jgi:aspartate kinase
MKFGGTSVKDADAMKKVIQIISKHKSEKATVVLSAASGMTDKLIELIINSPERSLKSSNKIIDEIENHHLNIIKNLISESILKEIATKKVQILINELRRLVEGVLLLKECTNRNLAQAESYGELLSTTIFNYACQSFDLKSEFLDARNVMKTDSNYLNAKVDNSLVRKNFKKIKNLFKINDFVITQGFIGSDKKGITTTLGRGGSDFSAAVFGASSDAKEIQIWTDVSGVLTTDPRIDKRARTIPVISNAEIRELSFYGAKVLHPDTIKPAVEKNIPVRILNTYKPNDHGTLVLNNLEKTSPEFHSVILKQNCLECKVEIPTKENSQKYFAEKISAINKLNLNILYSACTEGNIVLIIGPGEQRKKRIRQILNKDIIEFKLVSLICLSGSQIHTSEQKSQEKSKLLKDFHILVSKLKINQIIYGVSPVSILMLSDIKEGMSVLKKIHSFILQNF